MNFLLLSQGTLQSCSSPVSFLIYFTINFTQYRSSHLVKMVDGIAEVISKPENLEASHTDFYNHISLINNIVSEDRLEILAKFDNSSSTELNISEIE